MKKILFTILAAAAMTAACTKFAEDVVPAYDTVGKPLVEANVAGDDSLTVVIAAGQNTHYYGYVVVEGTLDGVSADKLVANGYAKAANVVVQGEDDAPQSAYYKYSEETKADTLYLSGLTPYTDYTVYAAAISPMGVLSEVVAVTVKTTDGTQPLLTDFDFEEADSLLTFAVEFSDPVALTGNGSAKAWFYAENHYDETGMLVLYKEVEIPADHMATSGNNLLLAVPAAEYIPGAYVAVTYSADIVKNGAEATNVAYETHLIGYDDTGAIQKKGIFGYYDYVSWDISFVDPATLPDEDANDKMEDEEEEEEEEEIEPIYFSDWSSLLMTAYSTSEYQLAGKTGNGGATVTAIEANGRTVSYSANTFGAVSANILGVKLNEAPAYGASLSFSFEEGTFCDIFGNENNAFEVEGAYYHSYGYTYDDVVGTYACAVTSYWYGPYDDTMTIEAYEPETEEDLPGNIAVTVFAGIPCETPIVGTFDFDAGFLTIPGGQLVASSIPDYVYDETGAPVVDENGEYVITSFMGLFMTNSDDGTEPLVLNMYKSGQLTNPSIWFGLYGIWEDGSEGWYDIFNGFSAELIETAPAPAPAARAPRARHAAL